MKRILSFISIALLMLVAGTKLLAQNNMTALYNYVKNSSCIAEGGTELFEYQGTSYLISVVPVIVSTKSEGQCKTVGNSKAKKEMLAYINGSDITSSTVLTNSETVVDGIDGRKVESRQEYVEQVKESVLGSIAQVTPLGGWYSSDRSVYYYSIYKVILL